MAKQPTSPLLDHPHDAPSAFRPEDLMEAVRIERSMAAVRVPSICVLDFDGDLADGLLREGTADASRSWACFHTQMLVARLGDIECGVIPRTIGGPYAVLIAEQLQAAGTQLIIGLTSAGRIAPALPLPSIVVVDEAVRDEGTSLHYLPPSRLYKPLRHRSLTISFSISRDSRQFAEGWCGRRTHHIARPLNNLSRGAIKAR